MATLLGDLLGDVADYKRLQRKMHWMRWMHWVKKETLVKHCYADTDMDMVLRVATISHDIVTACVVIGGRQ